MPYEKPYENDQMTTDFVRDNIPVPPETDEKMKELQEIELDLIQGFKTSAVYSLYQPSGKLDPNT